MLAKLHGVGGSQELREKCISEFPGLLSSANDTSCRTMPDWGVEKAQVIWLVPVAHVLKPQYSNYLRKFRT